MGGVKENGSGFTSDSWKGSWEGLQKKKGKLSLLCYISILM